MTSVRLILTTSGSREEAQAIASALLEARLAACVNIAGPIESRYWWKGKIDSAAEYLLLIKTSDAMVERIHMTIRELHSYEVPEFLVLNIDSGDAKYLKWIASAVRTD
jgi:periplasmic divalent cation tolerance protein